MVGYGPEDDFFVLELTYNYEKNSYELGNELEGIYIKSDEVHNLVQGTGLATTLSSGGVQIRDPDGHPIYICAGSSESKIVKIGTRVKQLDKSVEYWSNHLGMKVIDKKDGETATLSYGEGQVGVEQLL
ncbi:unnamed protein product [Strongylus vulgaris]|uniref:VOC domain-containing protein n=1 Tax=Strongylus vulgaris TaxID=40348 RepID=A0A3P7KNF9_STRVU|nr:unnamed protein product [Strongylus vulgaris]